MNTRNMAELGKQIFDDCFPDAALLKIAMHNNIINGGIKHAIGKRAAESNDAAVKKASAMILLA
ncbi:hypothetical protein PspKH34_19570 [Parageobacillus sp. KH3-4]|nr:hypothetical protein PspKH34_19570 [Parageobacillus sp. KH3-4]